LWICSLELKKKSFYRFMNKLAKAVAVVWRWDTGHIFTQKSSLEKVLYCLSGFKRCQNIYNTQYVKLTFIPAEYTSIHSLKNVVNLLMCYLSFVLNKSYHKWVVIYVIFLEKFAICCYLVSKNLRNGRF